MSDNFLIKEYELCFEQLRFYDARQMNVLKYLFSLSSAVATAQFAVYKFLKAPTQGFFACQAFLGATVFAATLLLYLSMLQNRLYFVYIARQLNAIRGHFLKIQASDFQNNQLYTSTDFSALKLFSVHTFQLIGAAMISALFSGVAVFGIQNAYQNNSSITLSLIVFLFVLFIEIIGGMLYLYSSGRKSPDHSIHGASEPRNLPNNSIEMD